MGSTRADPSSPHHHLESFPRMWDQPPSGYPVASSPRIIPTYVGSTSSDASSPSVPSNHSHVCGINAGVRSPWRFCNESFPRMWDQPHATMPEPLSRSNHSHVCGINNCILIFCSSSSESFPRMWDQRGVYPDSFQISRIIPTYVGSTDS